MILATILTILLLATIAVIIFEFLKQRKEKQQELKKHKKDILIKEFYEFLQSEFDDKFEFQYVILETEIRFRVDFKNKKQYKRAFKIDAEITIDDLKNEFLKNTN